MSQAVARLPGMDANLPDHRRTEPAPTFTIDCASCVMQDTDACGDCVVTYICSREPGDALVVDLGEYRALELLAESGLAPALRHRRRRTG